ncbi:MAG: hypothetical protein Q4F84_02780, partial [Fibrobacter sp.]|nr:hypothetical protein [Fibrobacter sp.]
MGKSLEKGASIIEILIATLIISISVLTIASFSRNTTKTYRGNRGSDAAYIAGQMLITDLSARAVPPQFGNDTVTVDNVTCFRSWEINSSFEFGKLITVNVSY